MTSCVGFDTIPLGCLLVFHPKPKKKGIGVRDDAWLYRKAIVQALRDLEEEGTMLKHRISYSQCIGRSIVIFLSISGLPKELRAEFIP